MASIIKLYDEDEQRYVNVPVLQGEPGIVYGADEPTLDSHPVWINPNGAGSIDFVSSINGQHPDDAGNVVIDVGGKVQTVNGKQPDALGNVVIDVGGKVQSINGKFPDDTGNIITAIFTNTLLIASDWDENGFQTISMPEIKITDAIFVSPTPDSIETYCDSGIICKSQGNGILTFSAKIAPEENVQINMVIYHI